MKAGAGHCEGGPGGVRVTLDQLVALLPPEHVYPSGKVVPISPMIKGRSFFPGGCGLAFGGAQPYPSRPIMLVGQDFDAAPDGVHTLGDWLNFDVATLQKGEQRSPTWRGIQQLADDDLLDLDRCYFTNALLGARVGKGNTGRNPGWGHEAYEPVSMNCLMEQIRMLKPTVVVALGVEATVLLARRLGLVAPTWDAVAPLWPSIDHEQLQFLPHVAYEGLDFAFASCVHPSYQHLNADKRQWASGGNALKGLEAHRAIWRAIGSQDAKVASRL